MNALQKRLLQSYPEVVRNRGHVVIVPLQKIGSCDVLFDVTRDGLTEKGTFAIQRSPLLYLL